MKKPIDPNLNTFTDDLEGMLDIQSEKFGIVGDELAEKKQDAPELDIRVKEQHSHHHHHHHHHSSGEHHSHSDGHHSSSHGKHSKKSKKDNKEKKKLSTAARIALIILIILLLLVFAVVGTILYLNNQGKNDLMDVPTQPDFRETIEYNGHTYVYNNDMLAMAFLGVDKRTLENTSVIGTAGQSDTNIVFAIDTVTGKATAIAVPRDTIAEVDLYSDSGLFLRSENMQLCLSYAYGDGGKSSAANTVTSISRVLGNIPISKYFALDLDGIAALNDAIGGVTLQSLYTFKDMGINKGDTIHIMGDMAETYVRKRDMDTVDASLNRTDRQVQYLKAYASQLLPAVINNFNVVTRLYNTASEYSSTDISLDNTTYLASLVLRKNIRSFDSITLKGEMKPSERVDADGNHYAEFTPDEKALMEAILSVFYIQID